jgi:hypothetical protein
VEQELVDKQTEVNELEVSIPKPQALAINPDAPLMVQVMQAVASGIKIDTDTIKAMQDIVRQEKDDAAKLAFATNFTLAQAGIGGVVKTRKNKQTDSMYAGLDDVIEMSKAVCSKHNFSVTFSEGSTEAKEHIRIIATVLHKDGHKELYHYDVPLGGKGIKGVVNMTAIHAKATSVSYGQRYLLCMIWNIPTKDNDGNSGNPGNTDKPGPTVEPPNEKETEVLQLIADKIPPKDGYVVSLRKIGALCFASYSKYPYDLTAVTAIAEWITTSHQDSQVYNDIR